MPGSLQKTASLVLVLLLISLFAGAVSAAPVWSAKLDGRVRFYQATELGVVVAGTEKSLYAFDGETGEALWRRKDVRLDETDVALVPGTDLLLLSFEKDDRSRLEAVDLFTGDPLWRSDKVRGSVMQMAVDLEAGRLAVVLARDPNGRARDGLKRRPVVYLFDLRTGDDRWKYEIDSEVEMMPARWGAAEEEKVQFTLDNYRPPLFVDEHLYLFYEGITVLDAATGKRRERERFRVNEEELALTEADPVVTEDRVYTSGRGRVRAVARATARVEWEAKDLGVTPEMVLIDRVMYVRTGGQFTRLRDGETVERGPYGVSAIEAGSGRTLWRFKGADRGITNIALPDPDTVIVADRDDLILIDAATGKRRATLSHRVARAAFVLINERGQAVVGGPKEVAAFELATGREAWRARHEPPGRGIVRTVAAIAARAAALYFRYGGAATTAFRGAQLARSISTLRWSGLATRTSLPSLTGLVTAASRASLNARFRPFGVAARVRQLRPAGRVPGVARSGPDIEDRLLDRLDPSSQLARLSRFLWRRQQLASLRGQWMYYYTDLKGDGGRGLVGVNINTGRTERAVRLAAPDERFDVDEIAHLLYVADNNRLTALPLDGLP
jgi:outer membrane protein assembly factor BamB